MRAEDLDLRFGSGAQVSLDVGFVHLRALCRSRCQYKRYSECPGVSVSGS